jgi:outer membrane protein assembly factor BamB
MKDLLCLVRQRLSTEHGHVLIYVIVVMIIFGLLGATMVSLFSTSITSTATPNYQRRAFYLYESGFRYSSSELLNNNPSFSTATVNLLNNTTYNLPPSGTFRSRVFKEELRSRSNLNPGRNLNIQIAKGKIPGDFSIPSSLPNISVIHLNPLTNNIDDIVAEVNGFSYIDETHIALSLADDFVVFTNEQVAFAVKAHQSDTINADGTLLIDRPAINIFPKRNGAIRVNDKAYFYRDRIDDESTNYVKLTNIQNPDNAFPLNVTNSTYVLLNPANYAVIAEGKSGEVTYGGKWDNQYGSVYDRDEAVNLKPLSRRADIDFAAEDNLSGILKPNLSPSNPTFISANNTDKSIRISGSTGFGTTWFQDTRPVGGRRDFCQAGECLFGDGIRVFFLFDYSGVNGDGFTFSLINGGNNNIGSVGGDYALSELLAYAGDSRLDGSANPLFADGYGGQGLKSPKMAIEFDGKTNNQKTTICSDPTTVNQGSRFDPDIGGNNIDTVQYVFWGKDTLINAPCRFNSNTNTNKTYDDNRHDAVSTIWSPYDAGSPIVSTPAVDSNNVYFGSGTSGANDGKTISLVSSNGNLHWVKNALGVGDNAVLSSPTLNGSHVYIGGDDGRLYKYNIGDGANDWLPYDIPQLDGKIKSKPVVPIATRTYVATEAGTLYKIDTTTGSTLWTHSIGSGVGNATSSPITRIDPITNRRIIYVGSLDNSLNAVRDDGLTSSLIFKFPSSGPIQSTPVFNSVTNYIYFGSVDRNLYAITTAGSEVRRFITGGEVVSSPALSSDSKTVYIGSKDGRLYALDAQTLNQRWQFPATGSIGSIESSPVVDTDGSIYFGSNDGHLYAVKANDDNTGAIFKWKFPPTGSIGAIKSSPVIGPNGIVYFGSDDGKLYAIDPSANDPPNIANYYLTSSELNPKTPIIDTNNWFTEGPWAVRLEVNRVQVIDPQGKYAYTLKTWVRQCQDISCSDILGTFYQDTSINYNFTPVLSLPFTQTIKLDQTQQDLFERFLFGFTSATSDPQTINISKFQMNFIRSNDPTITDDPLWVP